MKDTQRIEALRVDQANMQFLKNKGFELIGTGCYATTHEFESDTFLLQLTEHDALFIYHKPTGCRKMMGMGDRLLTDSDFEFETPITNEQNAPLQ